MQYQNALLGLKKKLFSGVGSQMRYSAEFILRAAQSVIFPYKIPKHPSPGEFLRSKVSEPLGARAFIGVREDELADYAPTGEVGWGFLFGNFSYFYFV